MTVSFLVEDNVCDYYSEDYDLDECESIKEKTQCKTVNGTTCFFPFLFRGKEMTNCITGVKRRQPWCPTKVNSDGVPVPGEWGFCNEQCPIEGTDVVGRS